MSGCRGGDSGEKSFETAGGQLSRYRLTTDQLAALRAYGRESEVEAGTILFAAGDDDADLIVVLAGELDLFDPGERGDARAMLSLGLASSPASWGS